MIEEILEKSFNVTTDLNITDTVVRLQDVIVILDKYDNQPDYKKMWNELKNLEIGEDEKGNKYYFKSDGTMKELEQKYNLGGE